MLRVAATPSITGICMSISTTSYSGSRSFARRPRRFPRVRRSLGGFEQARGHFLIDFVVLDQENARAAPLIDVVGGASLRGVGALAVGAETRRRRSNRIEELTGLIRTFSKPVCSACLSTSSRP